MDLRLSPNHPCRLPRPRPAWLLLGLLLVMCAPALAFDPDSKEPINITADSARLDERAGRAIYEGDVVVTQGETRLEAQRIVLTRGEKGLDAMEATGNPARYQQPAREDEPALEAEAQRIHYQSEFSRIRFRRDAQIRQGGNSFRGDRIDYDINDRVVTANGEGGGDSTESPGRVEMTIQPRQQEQ
ncbi:MAG: lipopolysaccharide transport periplasmic protein LptA [Oleiphilaceae bacterium]|nr:lipopolysaccharide transport periplasmic protein LptA [Oleiphilaceae bacterium]